jgi:hypothetical protein
VNEVGAIAWFYDGPGGGFDYWPDGPTGPMQTESAPFDNVAIVADTDSTLPLRWGVLGRM